MKIPVIRPHWPDNPKLAQVSAQPIIQFKDRPSVDHLRWRLWVREQKDRSNQDQRESP